MSYDDESPCRPDRTPQKTVKRLRREEVSEKECWRSHSGNCHLKHFGVSGLCDPQQANSTWFITNKSAQVRSETIHDTQFMAIVVSFGYQIPACSILHILTYDTIPLVLPQPKCEEVLELLKVSEKKSIA